MLSAVLLPAFAVDGNDIAFSQIHKAVNDTVPASNAGHFRKAAVVTDSAVTKPLLETARFEEEFFEGLNTLAGSNHGWESRVYVQNVYGKVPEDECCLFVQAVVHVPWQKDGKAKAVGEVVLGRKFVLDPVAGEGDAACGSKGEAVQSPGAGPHDVRPCRMVIGICQNLWDGLQYGLHEGFHDEYVHAKVGTHEVDLKVVREGVDGSAGSLEGWNRIGERGIKEGGHGKERGVVEGDFFCRVLVCDNAEGIHVQACAGKGGDGYDRQKALHFGLAGKKVPGIAFIKGCGTHEFCAVYDRSPANCQDDVYVLLFADGSHAVDRNMPWVGFHTTRLEKRHRCIGSNLFDGRIEGSLFDARASIDHEAAASVILELASQIGQLLVAKVDFGWDMEGEICAGQIGIGQIGVSHGTSGQ